MKRKIINKLIHWKNSNSNKPIIITGAKGVGKTYLAYDFAKAFFAQIFYINFEREPGVCSIFKSSDINFINDKLKEYFHIKETKLLEDSILIIDEYACCPELLKTLVPLQQVGLFSNIIAITSNPDLSLIDKTKFYHFPIFPFDFDEFLKATANDWYIETIITHFNSNNKIPDIVHKELLQLFELYIRIGGMPGSINEYQNLSSEANVGEQHSFLLASYYDYIIKSNQDSDALKMKQVMDSLILQLMKDNKKFQYKLIRKGTTHGMYKDAIQYLSDHHYVIKCDKLTTDLIKDRKNDSEHNFINEGNTNFKLYMLDVGMLHTKMLETSINLNDKNSMKALLENYVAQALTTNGYQINFWESNSMAKIDFVIQKEQEFVPIEVYKDEQTRSKSISVFKQQYDIPYAIKVSSRNFEHTNDIKYVPYYAVFCL